MIITPIRIALHPQPASLRPPHHRASRIPVRSALAIVGCCAALLCGTIPPALAAALTWDGGGGNGSWSVAANWLTDVAPSASGDTLTFAGSANLSASNDVVTALGTTGTAVTFASGAGPFILSGSAITMGSGGGAGQVIIQQNSSSNQTVALNINLSGGNGDRSIVFGAGAGSLTLAGNIAFNGDWLFPTTTAGTLILSGTNTGDGKATNAITAGTNIMRAMMRNNVAGTQLVLGSDGALGNNGTGSYAGGNLSLRGIIANQQLNISTASGDRNLSGSTLAINASNITFNGPGNLTIGNIVNVGGNRDFVVSGNGTVSVPGSLYLSSDQTGRQIYLNLSGAGGLTVSGSVMDTMHSGGLTTGSSTLRKAGTGTLRLSGNSTYAGTTQADAGTLLVNGVHAPSANSGRYLILSGATLGGTGTIRPFDSTGSLTGISINGTVSPGDPAANGGLGSLTLNGSNSTRSLIAFETGATLNIRLGSGLAASKVALAGGQVNDVFFNNNVVNFTDVSGGNLSSGSYVIFSSDVAGAFSGLTTDGNGTITAGLTIGSGLSSLSNTSLQVVGNNIVVNLTNSNEPVPVGLGFNVKLASTTGMTPSELAGAPGVRFANWNNFDLGSGASTITNIVDSNGAAVTGVTVTLSRGSSNNPFSRGLTDPNNDRRMFDTVLDQFNGTASTITVSGIPYGTYDVYLYMADDGAARGGTFTVGGTTYYLRGGAGTPTSAGSGYVQSTDTSFNSGNDTQANYVKFSGLSGNLTATFVAVNEGDTVQRLKFPGFQIVGTASPVAVAPSAPASVTITPTSNTSFTIGWTAVNGATGYQVFRSTSSGVFDFNNPIGTVSAPGLAYTDATASSGTTYFYVVRAVNSGGSSGSSAELTNPPPDLSSAKASSPVIWPGGNSTLSWSVPNAVTLTLDDGSGAQARAATGNLTVSPAGNTTYTFTATNGQGTTTTNVTVTVVPKPASRDSLWQWSVPITAIVSSETNDNPRAFLYIPPGCKKVRGVIIGQHNMLEEPVLEHTAVRQALADANMAAIWVSPAFDGTFNFTTNPNTPAIFQDMMDALAAESGYAELSKTPVVWIGHSAMANAPYHFAAWDLQQHGQANRRCAAAISIKGWYPGYSSDPDVPKPAYANTDLAGVPIMYIEGEYADANGRAAGALNFQNGTAGSIVSFLADVGGGHFDWNDKVCEYIGMYLRKLAQYRLPATAAADGTAVLLTVNPAMQGWRADRWRKGQSPAAAPAPVGSYTGNLSESFWYFDSEHAQTTHNSYLPVKTVYQLAGYTQNGTLVTQIEDHLQVHPSFSPEADGDGLTFKLGTAFLDSVPAVSSRLTGWTGLSVGSPIGHSTEGPIQISRICGPVEQLSPDTFRIAFDRVGTENIYGQTRSRDIVLMAVHPGDSTYVRAVQQSIVRFSLPLTSGANQTITFPAIADQPIGTASIPLAATTNGTATYPAAKVSYYVREGPAKVVGETLEFTPVPPRAKFPVKVTVVATQYGRTIAPLLKTAAPVVRTFFITASEAEQWRLQNFGAAQNSGDAADAADPDGDAKSNQNEFGAGTDPLDGADFFKAGIAAQGGGFEISFTAKANRSYVIEYTTDLVGGTWQPLANVAGEAADTTILYSDPAPGSRRFYRVRTPGP